MNRSEDISKNVDFGPKRGKFGPKRILRLVSEKLAEMSIFGLKRAFLDLNWPKTGQTGFFGQNPKMSLPLH